MAWFCKKYLSSSDSSLIFVNKRWTETNKAIDASGELATKWISFYFSKNVLLGLVVTVKTRAYERFIFQDNCAVNFTLTCEDIREMSVRFDYLIKALRAVHEERSRIYSFTALVCRGLSLGCNYLRWYLRHRLMHFDCKAIKDACSLKLLHPLVRRSNYQQTSR